MKNEPVEITEAKLKDAQERLQLEQTLNELTTKLKTLKKGKTISEIKEYLHEGTLASVWSFLSRSSKSLLSRINSNSSRMYNKTTSQKIDLLNQNLQILTAIVIKQNTDSKKLVELALLEYDEV